MKRYTGQQALYEAISRSRAKAKQGSILDKLRPEHFKPETQAAEPASPVGQQQAKPEPVVEPPVQASPEPQVVETPPQPVIEHEPQDEPRVETLSEPEPMVEVASMPVELPEPVVKPRPIERVVPPAPPSPVQTWLKPRPVQLNEGRIEISVPYYVGAIAGLVVLLVVVGAFRLGQAGSGEPGTPVQPVVNKSGAAANPPIGTAPRTATPDAGRPASNTTVAGGARQNVTSTAIQGDHWLVLAHYKRQDDFVPVIQHFRENGINLGVVSLPELRKYFAANNLSAPVLPTGDGFFLVTADAFSNPKISGTDGFKMKQRITEVGAQYKGKAPSGFESFAPNYFSDAYPMKIR